MSNDGPRLVPLVLFLLYRGLYMLYSGTQREGRLSREGTAKVGWRMSWRGTTLMFCVYCSCNSTTVFLVSYDKKADAVIHISLNKGIWGCTQVDPSSVKVEWAPRSCRYLSANTNSVVM